MHVWMDAPLTARVTLNMKDYGGREVGLSAKSVGVQHVSSTHRLSAKGSRDSSLHVESTRRCLMCRCEHILNAKSSRDAFVAQRHEGHFCGCVMHGRATQGSCIAQHGAFDGRAVGGAPGAIFIYGAITNTL